MISVFDTNILIDYLRGIPKANEEFQRARDLYISRISWMEVLVGGKSQAEKESLNKFLQQFTILEITPSICQIAVDIKAQHRMALPDTIIWATAKNCRGCLTTRNHKDFPETLDGIRITIHTWSLSANMN